MLRHLPNVLERVADGDDLLVVGMILSLQRLELRGQRRKEVTSEIRMICDRCSIKRRGELRMVVWNDEVVVDTVVVEVVMCDRSWRHRLGDGARLSGGLRRSRRSGSLPTRLNAPWD